jgi:hypothetical protein
MLNLENDVSARRCQSAIDLCLMYRDVYYNLFCSASYCILKCMTSSSTRLGEVLISATLATAVWMDYLRVDRRRHLRSSRVLRRRAGRGVVQSVGSGWEGTRQVGGREDEALRAGRDARTRARYRLYDCQCLFSAPSHFIAL